MRELAPRQIQLGSAPRDGVPRSTVNATFFDGHWLPDGRIVAIDIFGTLVQFTMTGAQYSDPEMPPNPWRIDFASLSGDGQQMVTFHLHDRVIVSAGSQIRWELVDRTRYGMAGGSHAHATLSFDGEAIAIACALEYRNAEGRTTIFDHAWLALEIRSRSRVAPILGRGWGDTSVLVFDRLARRLLIGCTTETKVVRLGPDFAPARFYNRSADQLAELVHHEPPRCAALDDRGLRAVYGFASRSELRIDYLSPKRTGPLEVEVLDQHRIAASFAPVALALDAEGTRIACLGDDGRVEIVPVP